MKITKRQIRRIVREGIGARRRIRKMLREQADDSEFVDALRDTWQTVSVDVDISNPTWEDKAEEASAMLSTYHPQVSAKFDGMPFKDQDMMLRLAFDPEWV